MYSTLLGILLLLGLFFYSRKIKRKIDFLKNNDFFYMIIESLLFTLGFYLLFESIFTAIGLGLINLFLTSLFSSAKKNLE